MHELARHQESKIVAGPLMPDHSHLGIRLPPKYAVSNVGGDLEGKRAIQIARQYGGRPRNFTGEPFWARGYFVSPGGSTRRWGGRPSETRKLEMSDTTQ